MNAGVPEISKLRGAPDQFMKLGIPLVFFDVETTGTNPAKDRILTFAALKVYPNGKNLVFNADCNPGVVMSDEVVAIHGITNEQASRWQPFKAIASPIRNYFDGCDLAGYNLLNFDIPILWEELHRAGIDWDLTGVNIVDACTIFRAKEERTLSAAVKFYCIREHEGAHGAMVDARATCNVLEAQLRRYPDLGGMTVSQLSEFCDWGKRFDLAGKIVQDKDGDPSYSFGKSKGMKVRDDLGYARWMLGADFSEQTKMVLRRIIEEIEVFL